MSTFSVSLVVSASLMVVLSRSWRVALFALLIQYVAIGVLVLEHNTAARSGIRILVGGLVCLILVLTARESGRTEDDSGGVRFSPAWLSDSLYRLAAVGLAGLGVFGSSIPDIFPSLPASLVLASMWLMAVGLVTALAAREALWSGLGLLTLESGFETLYTAIDPRLVPAGLLAVAGLLLALLVAFVVAAQDPKGVTP